MAKLLLGEVTTYIMYGSKNSRLRARHTYASRQCLSESLMSGEYFVRLIATAEWGVCLLSSCKVKNKNIFEKSLKVKILSLDIKYMMFFGVTVQEID